MVDVESIAFNDGANALDWSQPTYRLAGRVMVERSGIGFGAEVAHQHLYWYSVRIPFGSTPIYREYVVSGTTAMALARLGVGAAALDLGAGVAFLDEPVGAVSLAVGWSLVGDLSLKLRADGILASEPIIPIGVAFSYAFRRR
jgi:hypothetical protein